MHSGGWASGGYVRFLLLYSMGSKVLANVSTNRGDEEVAFRSITGDSIPNLPSLISVRQAGRRELAKDVIGRQRRLLQGQYNRRKSDAVRRPSNRAKVGHS